MLYGYIQKTAEKYEATLTDVVLELIRLGAENKKAVTDELKKLKTFWIKQHNMEMADAQIKIMMKESYYVSNLKKLTLQLRNQDVSNTYKEKVLRLCLERIKLISGEESESFKEATKWLKLKE